MNVRNLLFRLLGRARPVPPTRRESPQAPPVQAPSPVPPAPTENPQAREAIEANLQLLAECIPVWTSNSALYIEEPNYCVIVSVEDVTHNADQFRLKLVPTEVLAAPPHFDAHEPFTVGVGWSNPYLSFGKWSIGAPYSFYLFIGADGVHRARQLWESLGESGRRPIPRGLLRACFQQPDSFE